MQGVHVLAWMPSEPRTRVPIDLIKRSLELVDTSKFHEVQAAVLMLVLLFTFARSETPCPKAFQGDGALDPLKHLLVEDVRVRQYSGSSYVATRLKSIKQDGRMERPEAAGNEDWILIGNANGVFSILLWIARLFAFHGGARDPASPFFLDKDRVRPLTYSNAMRDVRALWERASSRDVAKRYGLHSLRVAGYNGAKHGKHGKTLAVAHGGWGSDAHERYERFDTEDVLQLASIISQYNETEQTTVASLQRAPLQPVPTSHAPPAPRPDVRRVGSASLRGKKRTRAHDTSHTTTCDVDSQPRVGDRIEVYWTSMRTWYVATLQRRLRGDVWRVYYDPHGVHQSATDLTFVHDLGEVRWRGARART